MPRRNGNRNDLDPSDVSTANVKQSVNKKYTPILVYINLCQTCVCNTYLYISCDLRAVSVVFNTAHDSMPAGCIM